MTKPARKPAAPPPEQKKPAPLTQSAAQIGWPQGPAISMTPEEWFNIEDNPRQRDTEHHANYATHLRSPAPTHYAVEVCKLPNGRLIKIDGHTRGFLWHEGRLLPPEVVVARCWLVPDLEAAKDLYTLFDNQKAAENLSDKLHGAKREFGLEFTSTMLSGDKFGSGLATAHSTWFDSKYRSNPYELLPQWKKELALLDACDPHVTDFIVPVFAASLILLRIDREGATNFITAFATDAGTKDKGNIDAVEAFRIALSNIKAKRQMFGAVSHRKIMKLMISMYEAYGRNQIYVRGKGIRVKSDAGFEHWIAKHKARWEASPPPPEPDADTEETEVWDDGE